MVFKVQGIRTILPLFSRHERNLKNVRRLVSSSTDERSPLNEVRVLDLTRIVAGPYCTMILGDLGAEVLKIEKPYSGDESRNWGPPFFEGTKESTYFMGVNRNKKSVCIDLKKGREIVYELAKESDILVENYVPGKLRGMGLDWESLKKIAPKLIYCSLTGYGSEGPYSQRPGYDVIAASIGGLLHITGPKNGDPCKVGVAMTDLATGLYAHGAIMAALLQREKTGKGQWIQCDLLSTQVASLINVASNYLNVGKEASRWGSEHESIVPYEAFPTKDGFMTVGAGSDMQFLSLMKNMDLQELVEKPEFSDNTARVQNREKLLEIMRRKFKTKTNEEWSRIFEGAPYPYGPVNTISQVFEDPHVKEIGLVKELPHPTVGKVKVVGPPVKYSYAENSARSAPPVLGQHTYEVLKNLLNYDDERIQSLIKDKVDVPTVRLRLRKPRSSKKVQWTQGTVDNEHMNKKKSKCCCIYEKPKNFGESSSEDSDDECENCHGHKDSHKKALPNNTQHPPDSILPQPEPLVTDST